MLLLGKIDEHRFIKQPPVDQGQFAGSIFCLPFPRESSNPRWRFQARAGKSMMVQVPQDFRGRLIINGG